MLSTTELQSVSDKIVASMNPEKIIVFGSYAKGTPTKDSDLDLLIIVKESKLPRHHRTRKVRMELLDSMSVPKDIIVYTQSEFDNWVGVKHSFIQEVILTGKTLYEKSK